MNARCKELELLYNILAILSMNSPINGLSRRVEHVPAYTFLMRFDISLDSPFASEVAALL